MTAYWPPAAPVADLGDIPDLTADFRPFRPVEPAPLRDPAQGPELTVDELLAAARLDVAALERAVALSRRARGADTELREVA